PAIPRPRTGPAGREPAARSVSRAAALERLVLVGPLDHVLANALDPLAAQRGREADHAVVGERAVVDDRLPGIAVLQCRAAPQVGQDGRSDRRVVVALAAVAAEVVGALRDLRLGAGERRRV